MSYLVFARKYRPQTFDEVVGQEAVATTLKNAIQSERVAHAYLFCGPRGVGKTSMARILSKALNCKQGPSAKPCNECEICHQISIGEDMDVMELDGASNRGIDEVRQIRDNVRYMAARTRFKIYIIDEVHMLTKEAFNALLKTLEEPPPHVKFLFATTEVHRIPETILSRCQRFDFKRITNADIVSRLKQICEAEGIEATTEVLQAVARAARGAMRDSQSLLDKLISFGHTKLTMESLEEIQGYSSFEEMAKFVDLLADRKAAEAMLAIDSVLENGKDIGEFLNQLIEHLRLLMLMKVGGEESPLLDVTQEEVSRLKGQEGGFSIDSLVYMIQLLSECRRQIRTSGNTRIPFELAVVKIAQMEDLKPIPEILKKLAELEQTIQKISASGVSVSNGPTTTVSPQMAPPTPASPEAAPHAPSDATPKPEAPTLKPPTEAAPQPASDTPKLQTESTPDSPPAGQPEPSDTSSEDIESWSGDLMDLYTKVVAHFRDQDSFLSAHLERGIPLRVEGARILFGFRRKDRFHQNIINEPARRGVIERVIAEHAGQPLALRTEEIADDEFVTHESDSAVESPSAVEPVDTDATEPAAVARSQPEQENHPLLKKVLDAFEGEIINVYQYEEEEKPS